MAEQLITLTRNRRIHRTSLDQFAPQKRGGVGKEYLKTDLGSMGNDPVIDAVTSIEDADILFITAFGRCWKAPVCQMPTTGKAASRLPWVLLGDGEHKERRRVDIENTVAMVAVTRGEKIEETMRYVVLATECGLVKRLALCDCFDVSQYEGASIMHIDDDDMAVAASLCGPKDLVWLYSSGGRVACIKASSIPVQSRRAKGVKGMELAAKDEAVVGMITSSPAEASLVTLTDDGLGKKVNIDHYPVEGRDTMGVHAVYRSSMNIASLSQIESGQELLILSSQGRCIRMKSSEIVHMKVRDAAGVDLMDAKEGKAVRALTIGPTAADRRETAMKHHESTPKTNDPDEGWREEVQEAFDQRSVDDSAHETDITITGQDDPDDVTYTVPLPKKKGFWARVRDLFK